MKTGCPGYRLTSLAPNTPNKRLCTMGPSKLISTKAPKPHDRLCKKSKTHHQRLGKHMKNYPGQLCTNANLLN